MQASDVITAAQRILNDASAARWSAATLLQYVIAMQERVLEKRRDLMLQADGTLETPTAIGDDPDQSYLLAVPDRYLTAAARYVAARALEEDNADTENIERAKRFMELFEQEVFGKLR